MTRFRFLAALFPLLAAGCTYNLNPVRESYPARWSPLRPSAASNCQELAGIYDATGEGAQPTRSGATIPRLLGLVGLIHTVGAAQTAIQAVYVSIQPAHNGNSYNVVALNSAKQPIVIGDLSEPISCNNGSLVRDYTRSSYADGNSHSSRSHVTLSLTSSGDLVAHLTGTSNTSDLLSNSKQYYDRFYKFTRSK